MNALDKVLTTSEVAKLYYVSPDTVKHLCTGIESLGMKPRLIPGVECRKAGRVWLITRAGIKRVYGEPKENKKDEE